MDTIYSLYGYWNPKKRRARKSKAETQSTRYMGIETALMVCPITSASWHNLLAIWVLKHLNLPPNQKFYRTQSTRYMGIETFILILLAVCEVDTIYSLYGYWNLISLSYWSSASRHNLLAIWVLKLHLCRQLRSRSLRHNLLAIWVLKHNIYKSETPTIKTQSTRYMGIETVGFSFNFFL